MQTVLVTGTGSGFGLEALMRLAKKGCAVVATAKSHGQVQPLRRATGARDVTVKAEELHVANDGDRKKALRWMKPETPVPS
ncbi:SDR family NAD(P)-dependent oxidoreductase [Bradyrhizobium sp.]|uniref:SDR family NAD(P)-dependent oxidoreductase n=1 Tax=Bradyrhizobium sp. TaxID=376 RepID=UPI003C542F8E